MTDASPRLPYGAPNSVFSPDFVANPFPLFAQLRTMGAVVPMPLRSGGPGRRVWMVMRWEEAVEVLKDPVRFTVDFSALDAEGRQAAGGNDDQGVGGFLGGRTMVGVDDPDHRRLRNLVSKVFTPRYIEGLRPRIQGLADQLLDRVQAQGTMDLVNDFAYPLPINVISDMLGVPPGERDQLREWSEAIGSGFVGDPNRVSKFRAFGEYTVRLVAEKRRHPGDDLTSQLVQIEETGDRLDEQELLSMVALLIFAGHETTSNLISIGTLALFDHPDQLARLVADPSLIPGAVEELLRFGGPVLSPAPRFVTEATEIGGQRLAKGDMLLIVLGSADRDPAQFANPEDLDIARSLNRHIAFGQGIHVCLGAPLARLEGQIAFATLLRRMPRLHLAIPREEVAWRGMLNLRGLVSLPVAF